MAEPVDSKWSVYMLRCADGTLYTGIATDVARRLAEHNHDDRRAAKYVRPRRPAVLVWQEPASGRSAASRRELEIKHLSRPAKEQLVAEAEPPEMSNR